VDGSGNVFVSDTGNYTIRKVYPVEGQGWYTTTLAGQVGVSGNADGIGNAAKFGSISAIWTDGSNNLFVSDNWNLRKLDLSDFSVTTVQPLGGYSITGLTMDKAGNYYCASNYTIIRFPLGGTPVAIAGFPGMSGSADGTNNVARFSYPTVFAVDASGKVYVWDTASQFSDGGRIRVLAPIGGGNWSVSTIPVSVNSPIAMDSFGNFYDSYYYTIRKIGRSGTNWTVSTIGGTSGSPGGADGTNSAARFSSSGGIAIGKDGRVFVTDTSANTIRMGEIVPAGALQVVLQPTNVTALWQLDGAGSWQSGGVTMTNLLIGTHTVAFSAVSGWVAPPPQTVTISSNQTTIVTGSYTQVVGSIQVNISPTEAADAGAQWQVDGGPFHNSGTIISNLSAGSHIVTFSSLDSWAEPNSQTVSIAADQTTNITGTYTPLGSLQIVISPAGAVDAGARWRVDGGAWQISGATVPNLAVGNHTIAFNAISGWASPPSQNLAIGFNQTTMATGVYNQQFGSLQAMIAPAGAVTAGAQWQLDGGGWQSSGTTLTNVPVGDHVVTFSAVSGWTSPTNQAVSIAAGQAARATGVYTGLGSLQIHIAPDEAVNAGAQWTVDGGAWQTNGAILSGLGLGKHLVTFKSINGWVTPASQTNTILASQTTTATGIYVIVNYTFSTLAGTPGIVGSVDGTNRTAQFAFPGAIAVDAGGSVYVADTGNSIIRKLTLEGSNWVATTIAGQAGDFGSADGANDEARFNFPSGIAVDANTNLYVADQVNSTIRKIAPDGTNWMVSTIAGMAGYYGSADGTGSEARFYYPCGLAVDNGGNVYVADQVNSTVRKITPAGLVSTIAGLAGTYGSANSTGINSSGVRFYWPSALAVDAETNIYVADTFNDAIRKLKPAGKSWIATTIAGQPGNPGSEDGKNNAALFDGPSGIALDASGNLYVADAYNSTIRKLVLVGTNWVVSSIGGLAGTTGSADGTNNAALFDSPQGIAADKDGNIFVVDTENCTIRIGSPFIAPTVLEPFYVKAVKNGRVLTITWDSVIGCNYQLQYTTSLSPSNWVNAGEIFMATNSPTVVPRLDNDSQRFYRIIALP
jgi:hypothetical protein